MATAAPKVPKGVRGAKTAKAAVPETQAVDPGPAAEEEHHEPVHKQRSSKHHSRTSKGPPEVGLVRAFAAQPEVPLWSEQHIGAWREHELHRKNGEWARLVKETRVELAQWAKEHGEMGAKKSQNGTLGASMTGAGAPPSNWSLKPSQMSGQGPLPFKYQPPNEFKEVRKDVWSTEGYGEFGMQGYPGLKRHPVQPHGPIHHVSRRQDLPQQGGLMNGHDFMQHMLEPTSARRAGGHAGDTPTQGAPGSGRTPSQRSSRLGSGPRSELDEQSIFSHGKA